jgi:hypothetical protein
MTITGTHTVIVWAGIAGVWLAYRLDQRGIETVLISSEGGENKPTIFRKWSASVINRRLMKDTAIATDNLFNDISTTQHPELKDTARRYVLQEFTELLQLIHFMPFEYGLIPRHVTPTRRLDADNEVIAVLDRVFTVGEARHDLVADCIVGLPWGCYLATAGMLCDLLSEKSNPERLQEFPLKPIPRSLHVSLLGEVQDRLVEIQEQDFSQKRAMQFVAWCREVRKQIRDEDRQDDQDFDLLTLAEAHTQSALARTESRGFFFRADFPCADVNMNNRCTYARYNTAKDCVDVELLVQNGAI